VPRSPPTRRATRIKDSLAGVAAAGALAGDSLPTARTTHRAGFLCVLVWCKACHHQAPADLQALVDAGRGDVPLKDLRFCCTRCGSRLTDSVVTAEDALGVQPWRAEAGGPRLRDAWRGCS
jgi:hypothetical protein